MIGLLVAGLLVLIAIVGVSVWRAWGSGPASQISQFETARAVTNRWSSDPTATPLPLQDYVRGQPPQTPPSDAESSGNDT